MKEERDIGKIIKSSLEGYEENYIEGSWENFNLRQRRRRVLLLRKLSAAVAAVVILALVVGGLLYKTDVTLPVTADVADSSQESEKITLIEKRPDIIAPGTEMLAESTPVKQSQKTVTVLTTIKAEEPEKATDAVQTTELAKEQQVVKPEEQTQAVTAVAVNEPVKQTFEEAQNREVKLSSRAAFAIIDREQRERKVRFGLNVAPGMSSATDGSALNISGGVNLDIAIAKNVDISTGVQLEHRNIDSDARGGSGAAALQQTSYSMTNLDIPLNITWRFKNSKTESYYVSGGFSSLAYLGESYTTTSFTQELQSSIVYGTSGEENTVYKLVEVRTTTTERSEPFTSFDLAGRLNLMVGYRKSISPKLNLHIEPFLKIPVSGMGSNDMRFTTSGITCKISFK